MQNFNKIKMEEKSNRNRNEIFSKAVRAGQRTYFFDVKTTRNEDKYITITESKRRFNEEEGKFFFEKHKLFLYKEDFEKFKDGLNEVVDFIVENKPVPEKIEEEPQQKEEKVESDITFEDLDKE